MGRGGQNRRSWWINKAPAGNSYAGGHENEFVLNLLNLPLTPFETTIRTCYEEYVLISAYIALQCDSIKWNGIFLFFFSGFPELWRGNCILSSCAFLCKKIYSLSILHQNIGALNRLPKRVGLYATPEHFRIHTPQVQRYKIPSFSKIESSLLCTKYIFLCQVR